MANSGASLAPLLHHSNSGFDTAPIGAYTPRKLIDDDRSPGSGPYPAAYSTDASLPCHTIYAPKVPPKGVKLPVLVFANLGCYAIGSIYQNFLREIASHGFIVLANGIPLSPKVATALAFLGGWIPQTNMTQMAQSLDWATKGGANGKFGDVEPTKIAVAGQSCGGMEAYSASYHDDRVKATILLNSGVMDESRVYLLSELKAPVALFVGGPKDPAYSSAERDWENLPKGLPVVNGNLDTGSLGTYWSLNGGMFASITVAYLKWVLKGDQEAKMRFLAPKAFTQRGWNISTKNWA